MPNILALDTSTDACSVAVSCAGEVQHRCELTPRRHNQRLFSMLGEVLPHANLRELEIDMLAYAHGPGSFTGLRIAASAVQGLAFSNDLPVAGISTLACMAQGAWRRGELPDTATALVLLDARINEVYWGVYELENGLARCRHADTVGSPESLPATLAEESAELYALGNGLLHAAAMPGQLRSRWAGSLGDLWPDSLDLLALGVHSYATGQLSTADQALPVYLRDRIGWKKLAEQGKQNRD